MVKRQCASKFGMLGADRKQIEPVSATRRSQIAFDVQLARAPFDGYFPNRGCADNEAIAPIVQSLPCCPREVARLSLPPQQNASIDQKVYNYGS